MTKKPLQRNCKHFGMISKRISRNKIKMKYNIKNKSKFTKVENDKYGTRNEMEENNKKLHGQC